MPEAPAASELPGRTTEYHHQDNRFVVERHAKRVSSPSSPAQQVADLEILRSLQLLLLLE